MAKRKSRSDDYERREQSRFHKLGTSTPRCPLCGETDWRVFESHHVAGRKHDDLEVPICLNCHRKVTDSQKDHPKTESGADHQLVRIGNFLMGLADLLEAIFERLREFGAALIARANNTSIEGSAQ